MRIRSLTYSETAGGWSLDAIHLKDGINLFVGASGSGKTRVLNMIFNIALAAVRERFVGNGQWRMHFEHSGVEYTWTYESRERVISEDLWVGTPDRVSTPLLTRTPDLFRLGAKEVPKLGGRTSGIYLLREEDSIKPVHEAFSRLRRRRFWSEDLQSAVALQSIPHQTARKLAKRADMLSIYRSRLTLNVLLYLLQRYFKPEFELICDRFKQVFPFVTDVRIRPANEVLDVPLGSDVPVALIKERGIEKPVPLNEIASGMQKVLLIIADVVTLPENALYLIDEYENSLGVNAINFLPDFIADCGRGRQYIITSHHPLLINAIPVADWFIFHRSGLHIRVMHGNEIEARYGRSKQQRFVQLINDPLYTKGVE